MSGVKDFSEDFMVEDEPAAGRQQAGGVPERETDPHRLAQRQKQIDLGKNTLGYQRYRAEVPREARDRRSHPMTPDIHKACSKRAFDGMVKKWRRMLHAWDLPEGEGEPALLSVHEDVAGPARGAAPAAAVNPPAPGLGGEPSDDFEHVSHADADPKNGAGLRQGGNRALPLKIPSAMRKRAFDETAAGSENHQPQAAGQRTLGASSAQPARGGAPPGAKHARRSHSRGGQVVVAAAQAKTPAAAGPPSEPSWAEQRYTDPQLDYGSSSSDDEVGDGGWQHVGLPGQYKMVFNNEAAWEEDIQI